MDESDGDDDRSITERLRRASSQSPANIPMLVVVSFNPDTKGLQKKQIEIQRGELMCPTMSLSLVGILLAY